MNRDKILTKLGELDEYLFELKGAIPGSISEYKDVKKRACERLLQISLETVLDVCNIIVSEMKLGVPKNEDDVLEKIRKAGIISPALHKKLIEMKRARNVLVHRYGDVEDKEIFNILKNDMKDFITFKKEIVKFVNKSLK